MSNMPPFERNLMAVTSRDAFNTYGNAQSYCDKIHNKATSINSKMP